MNPKASCVRRLFGDDVALLLHGFSECRISWRHQLVPLARLGRRVVAMMSPRSSAHSARAASCSSAMTGAH
jgi:hypothetical protein